MIAAGYPNPCQVSSGAAEDIEHGDIFALLQGLSPGTMVAKPATGPGCGVHPEKIREIIKDEELFTEQLAACKDTEKSREAMIGKLLQTWTRVDCNGLMLMTNGEVGRGRRFWVVDSETATEKTIHVFNPEVHQPKEEPLDPNIAACREYAAKAAEEKSKAKAATEAA